MSATPLIVLGGSPACRVWNDPRVPVFAGTRDQRISLAVSKFFTVLPKPPLTWDERYGDWLHQQLKAHPGAVVLPGADDANWWLARHAADYPGARLAVGSFESIRQAATKSFLSEEAARAGVAMPPIVLLRDEASLAEAGASLRFPLVLKPQSRIGMSHWTRGQLVRNHEELRRAYEWFTANVTYQSEVLADVPEMAFPFAQEYVRRPAREVYHLVGYISASGTNAVAAHRKLLQAPLRFGSGVCFESTEVDWDLAASLIQLLRQIGYYGIFEAEYVQGSQGKLLLDLNVRTYNGLALEAAAGFDLVGYAYMEALGDPALDDALAAAAALPFRQLAWCNHVQLANLLTGQLLNGGVSLAAARNHLGWAWRNRTRMVNPYFSREDPRVGFAQLLEHLVHSLRDPRDFLGLYFRKGMDR